jgi:NAD(P)H-hydrate epimerase
MRKVKPTTLHQWKILHSMKVPFTFQPINTKIRVIIDALLGYNIKGNPRESTAVLIRYANETGKPIVALDLPSGLDPDTGKAFNPCIRATSTLTLALPKTGLMVETARSYVGDIYLADIGIPKEVYEEVTGQDASFLQTELAKISGKKHP